MREFKIEKNPNDCGILYYKNTAVFEPGVTVLIGCNGCGKTTMIKQIEKQLEKDKIPYAIYDNIRDGGHNARERAGFYGDMEFIASSICSSEGENIVMNMGKLARDIGDFVRNGRTAEEERMHRMARAFQKARGEDAEEAKIIKERWILLDAVDSGLSVDNIVDIKEYLFKTILEHNDDNEIYIVISANEYEMAREEKCFDVYNGKYVTFNNYEEYRDFILQSKEWKNQRDETEIND